MTVESAYIAICGLLAFFIGLLAGFQAIFEKYNRDSFASAATLPGTLYLLSRGGVPAILFASLHHYGKIQNVLWLEALVLGAGSEIVLRSRFFIKQTVSGTGPLTEDSFGPFNLLRWYQNLCLEYIDERRAATRANFVKTNLPDLNFLHLCERVKNNSGAFKRETQDGVRKEVDRLRAEHAKEIASSGKTPEIELRYKLKLGFAIYHIAGEKSFKTLFS